MTIFDYTDDEALGTVQSADTAMVVIKVADIDRLRQLQVNRLVVLHSSRPGQHLLGMVQKITRSIVQPDVRQQVDLERDDEPAETNLVRIALIGTLIDRIGTKENIFRRTLETVPEIDANCFSLEGTRLTTFMAVISEVASGQQQLSLGHYTLDMAAEAFLNGNKLFQRHAAIVGSTGSGKSWTTARILEQVAELPSANALVFDVHGEYAPLRGKNMRHFRIAGPADLDTMRSLEDDVLYLPYWLLDYEAMISMFVDRSEENAPNQAMVMARAITKAKKEYLRSGAHQDVLDNFTVDSPIPYDLERVVEELNSLNTEMVEGSSGRQKQGDFHGKLSRMIARFENKRADRRLGFLFRAGPESMKFDWLGDLAQGVLGGQGAGRGLKVIDFSEVPSDILPLIVSLIARLAFTVQQWTPTASRHPIALFCDEAHLYIPERVRTDAADEVSVGIFERIAKEGRKYGVGLIVISQRPAEVNRTVLSQCNNLIAMRLTNAEDQAVVRRLLPDSLGGFGDVLPILDVGEVLVVGDASLLPSRVRVAEPKVKPDSATINFWDRWAQTGKLGGIPEAVQACRRQSLKARADHTRAP